MRNLLHAGILGFILVLTASQAFAHRWFMHEIPFRNGTDFSKCLMDIYKAANKITSIMESKGYKKGKIVQGEKSIRVDGIGYDNASIYLFCSPVSIYILTGHMTGDDDRFWDQLYNNLISLFPRD